MPVPSFTAAQWRERAERTRAIVEKLTDASARNAMAMLARAYERLASEATMREPRRDSAIH